MTVPLHRKMSDGQIIIQDGGANTLTLDTDQGDLSLKWGSEANVRSHRGALSHFRDGVETPVEVSFSVVVSKISADDTSGGGSDTDPTPEEALTGNGLASGWTSTGQTGEPYQSKLVFKIANPDTSGRREVITINKLRCNSCEFSEGEDEDTLSFSGVALITRPAFSFEAQS